MWDTCMYKTGKTWCPIEAKAYKCWPSKCSSMIVHYIQIENMQAVVIMGHALDIVLYTKQCTRFNSPFNSTSWIQISLNWGQIYWQYSFLSELILPLNLWIWRKHWLFKFVDWNFRNNIFCIFVVWNEALVIHIHWWLFRIDTSFRFVVFYWSTGYSNTLMVILKLIFHLYLWIGRRYGL